MLDKDSVVKFHKLCGAGGGGYFLIIMDDIEEDIESSHVRGNRIKINIDNKGVTVWKI